MTDCETCLGTYPCNCVEQLPDGVFEGMKPWQIGEYLAQLSIKVTSESDDASTGPQERPKP